MNTRRILIALAIAASSLALTACETNPVKPEPAAPPAPKKSLVEMEYELRKLEIEGQTAREERAQKAAIKFAAESGDKFAQGFVAASLVSGQRQAQAEPQRRSLLDAVNQEADRDLRRAELEERTSWWNRGLQVTDRVLGFRMFSKGLDQERYRIDASNSQTRYMFDNLRGTQQDAYTFTGSAFTAGSAATLGGVSAGSTAAATGAAAVANANATAPAATDTSTPAATE